MLFLTFLFLFISVSPAFADNFSGDNVNNQYFQTISFNVEEFPKSCSEAGCMEYEENTVLGEDTTNFLDHQMLSSLTDFGNMRRIPMVADRVVAPPGTRIDILYYYLNSTGHHINISHIAIPFSKNDFNQGNLSNLVSFPNGNPVPKSITTLFNGNNLARDGNMKDYAGTGLVLSGETGTYKIDEMIVMDPLNVDHFTVVENGDVLDIKVWIQNNSVEYLNSITYEHDTYSYTFDFPPFEEVVLEYSLENIWKDESVFDLGSYKIINPNTKTECAVQGTNYYNWTQVNAVSVMAYRDDGGWINGGYIQPAQESFCVTRIPYSVYSPQIIFERENVEEEKTSVDNDVKDTPEESEGEILGISNELKELPKTGKGKVVLLVFLVVDAYLWYAFLKVRRNYEDYNKGTRVCTKSS